MGILNAVKGQLLSSINYRMSGTSELGVVYDRENKRIMYGSVLTVTPGQAAILVNEGQVTDIYEPGRYELTTSNMPITTTLKEWKFGFNESFIVDVTFVNTAEIIDIPWGTSQQITVKDAVFGLVNIGAHGKYSFKITDPKMFLENLMGTKRHYSVDDFKNFMTPQMSMYFKEVVTEKNLDFFDMQGYCYEAAEILRSRSDDLFGRYGMQLQKVTIEVALPEEVKKAINERAALGALGGLDAYAYKRQVDAQADAMVAMANNPNGGLNSMAGMGMQMAAGVGMMNAMSGQMTGQVHAGVVAAAPQNTKACVKCGAQISATSKFCPECGAQQTAEKYCAECGAKVSAGAKYCPECGKPIA